MKATLSKVVNEDLKKDMKKIKTKTLIIWGKNDTVTPYKDAIRINKLIENSQLIALDTDHFSYIKKENDVINIINKFIGSD
jgi:pimeloyl-ACP methyl ester carboxylesterase